MPYATNNPYELWSLHKSIGVMRDVLPAYTFFLDQFHGQVDSTDEYIDFEKLPRSNRKLAPFVMPMGQGKPIYTDRSTAYRFKPAYIKLRDAVDTTRGLSKIPGIDAMLTPNAISPMQRRELLKVAITQQHVITTQRRWEWMAARALIDGTVVIGGNEEYPPQLLDFQRNADQTVVLTGGACWGQSGVSILDFLQAAADKMIYPAQNSDGTGGFGGFPTKLLVGGDAWAVMRKDAEIKDLMNKFFVQTTGTFVERGLVGSEKVVKVGDLGFGGTSGVSVEVWLYRDSYVDDNGAETLILPANQMVLLSSPEAINGQRCFGAIIDPHAGYQCYDIFARNWMEEGDPAVEYILHQSAPLMVPVNPNATFKATVV
jgi:hypothetical protein